MLKFLNKNRKLIDIIKHFCAKKIFYSFILASSILIWAKCSSPTDVPANRKIIEDKQNEKNNQSFNKTPISVNTRELVFDEVPYQGSKPNSFIIYNNSTEPQNITKIYSDRYREYFKLYSPTIPFTLGPKGSDSSEKQVIIIFYGNKLGETFDKLKINDYPDLSINLKGYVPNVDISDCDFGFAPINTPKSKAIILINYSSTIAKIRGFNLIDQDSVFKVLSSPSVDIKPNEQIYFYIRFTPKETKPYNGKIEFYIEASGYIDNDAILTGTGIRN
jgi:hypothetical protein